MSAHSGRHGARHGGPVLVVGYDGSDGSRAALKRALERVRDGGRVVVVHAWQAPAFLRGSELWTVVVMAVESAAESLMERLPAEYEQLGDTNWEPRLVEGPAGKAIAEVAEEVGADEVLVGASGAGRLHAVLGGTAQSLLHDARCPVTFMPSRMVDDVESVSGADSTSG